MNQCHQIKAMLMSYSLQCTILVYSLNFVKFRQKSIFSSRPPVFVIPSVFRQKRNPLEPNNGQFSNSQQATSHFTIIKIFTNVIIHSKQQKVTLSSYLVSSSIVSQTSVHTISFFLSFFGVWSNFNRLKTRDHDECIVQKCPGAGAEL